MCQLLRSLAITSTLKLPSEGQKPPSVAEFRPHSHCRWVDHLALWRVSVCRWDGDWLYWVLVVRSAVVPMPQRPRANPLAPLKGVGSWARAARGNWHLKPPSGMRLRGSDRPRISPHGRTRRSDDPVICSLPAAARTNLVVTEGFSDATNGAPTVLHGKFQKIPSTYKYHMFSQWAFFLMFKYYLQGKEEGGRSGTHKLSGFHVTPSGSAVPRPSCS